jgi:glycosyltransferase involved in cell wall biosynthesis
MNRTLFSVIVPTHERPRLLERCLTSLKQQTFRDFEIVVVTDEPGADTHAAAGKLLDQRDVFIRRRGAPGPAASRNLALQVASGDFVLFLDDDDTIEPELLARYADSGALDANTVLYCDMEEVFESRASSPAVPISSRRNTTGKTDLRRLRVQNYLPNNCVLVPRHAALRVGFDEGLQALEDWEFLIALLEFQRFIHLDFFGPRIHRDQDVYSHRNTQDEPSAALNHLSIYRKWRGRDDAERSARAELLAGWGLPIPADWL